MGKKWGNNWSGGKNWITGEEHWSEGEGLEGI